MCNMLAREIFNHILNLIEMSVMHYDVAYTLPGPKF